MNIQEVCKLIYVLLSVVIIAVLIYAIKRIISIIDDYAEHKKSSREYEIAYTYYLNKEDTDYNIDNFINEIFDMYIAKSGLASNENITDNMKREIIPIISREVLESMSPFLLREILLVYNENKLADIINCKVALLVFSSL